MGPCSKSVRTEESWLTFIQYGGQSGVELGLKMLQHELMTTMALAGRVYQINASSLVLTWDRCRTIADINRSHLSVLGQNNLLARL